MSLVKKRKAGMKVETRAYFQLWRMLQMAGVTSRDGRLPLLLPIVIIILIMVKSLKAKVVITETSQSICGANQLTGFYMMVTLTFND